LPEVLSSVTEAERLLCTARFALRDICDLETRNPGFAEVETNRGEAKAQKANSSDKFADPNLEFKKELVYNGTRLASNGLPLELPKPEKTKQAVAPRSGAEAAEPRIHDEIVTKVLTHWDPDGAGDVDDGQRGREYMILHTHHPTHPHRREPQTIQGMSESDAKDAHAESAGKSNIQNELAESLVMVTICQKRCAFRIPVSIPDSKFRIAWVLINLPVICYEAFSLPFYLAFDDSQTSASLGVSALITLYYLVDIPVHCVTGYYDDRGTLVMDPRKIWRRYLKTWFIFDAVAAVPWGWFGGHKELRMAKWLKFLHAIRLVHLFRFLRLLHMKGFSERIIAFIESSQLTMLFTSVTKIVFVLFAVTHWAACIGIR
jgi:hypothetical protein